MLIKDKRSLVKIVRSNYVTTLSFIPPNIYLGQKL